MGAPRPTALVVPRLTPLFCATRLLVRGLLRLWVRFRVEGIGRYPAGPAVIVANHPSALDPMFIAAAVPDRVLFLAAREFLAWPLVGWAMRAYGCIPVRRGGVDTGAVRLALRALAAGVKVGVFPEGRVSPTPGPLRPGAGMLAAVAGVPLLPVAVIGSGRAFPLGARYPRPARVIVKIGATLPPPGAGGGGGRGQGREAPVGEAMAWVFAEAGGGVGVRRRWRHVLHELDGAPR
ncbi:MAG: lysophospholipid acyltransferase family protein [Armatimonadota bacterium]|nr:lysophospholipid acyltransferase family protein [Armatimonadota bacterium]